MLNDTATGALLAILGSLLVFGLIFVVVLLSAIITFIILSFVFKKASVPVWKAWVPFYNVWVCFELAGYKGWLSLALPIAAILMSPIPVIGFLTGIAAMVGYVLVAINFQRAYGHKEAFALLFIFFPIIWLAMIAFDKNKYDARKLLKVEPEILAK